MESLNAALVECVKACGGSKKVGPLIWPEKNIESAQRQLLDCLNDDRPAHLTPEQVMLILKLARQKSCHVGFSYMAEQLGYSEPVPMEPHDEYADLQRQFIAAQQEMASMVNRPATRLASLVLWTSLIPPSETHWSTIVFA